MYGEILIGRGWLAFLDNLGAFDSWLDDVEVREAEAVQLRGNITECSLWIAVRHGIVGTTRREPYTDTIATSHGHYCFQNFQQEAGAVFYRAAIIICPLVAAVL